MKRYLLIVAAGKSSRFGGFPKAFVSIGDRMNIENTVQNGLKVFDRIFFAVNREIYDRYKDKIENCEMFPIETGNGEAHSLLKCLKHLKTEALNKVCLSVCWGDAYFMNERPFAELLNQTEGWSVLAPVVVACAWDRKPYAWFETEEDVIKKARFASCDGEMDIQLHDQSLFLFDLDIGIRYLSEYKELLDIPDEYITDSKKEMKLLYSFDFLYESGQFAPARWVEITAGNVLSFNTKEELENIKQIVNAAKGEQSC